MPIAGRSPWLYRHIAADYDAGRVSRLHRPVDVLRDCGCVGIMTVQVGRELIQAEGGFDEKLGFAENYDLWLRLAKSEDLYVAPLDAGIYRVRSGSLTKSGRPMYYCEDLMLLAVKKDSAFAAFDSAIDRRLVKVYSTFCYHFRVQRQFAKARRYAFRLLRVAPTRRDGWRHLAAVMLRR